ncbi:MAG: acetyltransferase [Hyphomicrobiales bacterium]|nr:MAG: acetyltransferase [Hyphomicrobiales bacterium]
MDTKADTRLGIEPVVADGAVLTEAELGRYTEVGERTQISHSRLGDYSYIMRDGDVLFADIGKFCSIASAVRINASNHPTWRATQHHFTYRSADYWGEHEFDDTIFSWRQENAVAIGNDVWIGHGATVMPGVTVGDGAVIGSGAVVTRSVAPYTIVAGVPAKPIRQRFEQGIGDRLQALAWWDWEHERLGAALTDFRQLSVEQFLEKYA